MPFKRMKDRPERSPYDMDDISLKRDFAGQAVHRGLVSVGLQGRPITTGLDDIAVPTEAGGKRFDLVLKGQRAKDYRATVQRALEERRREILDAKALSGLTAEDFDVADAVETTVIVEGFWKKRWWKSPRGQWNARLEMHVVRFHFELDLDGTPQAERGRLPEMA